MSALDGQQPRDQAASSHDLHGSAPCALQAQRQALGRVLTVQIHEQRFADVCGAGAPDSSRSPRTTTV
jgi:hypothetical protein